MLLDWLASSWAPCLAFAAVAGLEQLLGGVPAPPLDAARWKLNLTLFVLEQAAQLALAGVFAVFVAAVTSTSPLARFVAQWPWWGQMLLAVVVLDAVMYAVHVASHVVGPLWRLHAVHHTDPDLDVATTVRHHPGEVLPAALALGCAAGLLGLGPRDVAAYGTVAFIVQMFAHARLRLPEPWAAWLGWLFVTPAIHAVHHSALRRETDSNYGEVFSVWDRLFGTFTRPCAASARPARYGLDGYAAPRFHTVRGALAQPFGPVARDNAMATTASGARQAASDATTHTAPGSLTVAPDR